MNEQPKPSLINSLAKQYDMDPQQFYAVIKNTVMPKEATNEQTAAFLMVAKEYGLSPLLKEIHAFPARRGGGIVPVISIDGWSAMVNRHPQYDGVEFSYDQDETGKILSITCTMWRKDRSHPTVVTEFMSECYRDSDAWRGSPGRMIRHRGFAQAARLTFGFSAAYDEENADYNRGFTADTQKAEPPQDKVVDIIAPNKRPPAAPPKATQRAGGRDLPPAGTETPPKGQTPASGQPPREGVDLFVDQISMAINRCDKLEELEDGWRSSDVEDRLKDDPDALELLQAVYAKAEKKLKAREAGR